MCMFLCRTARTHRAALAIRCTDGVAFAVEKAVASKLICPKAARKTHIIAEHIGSV